MGRCPSRGDGHWQGWQRSPCGRRRWRLRHARGALLLLARPSWRHALILWPPPLGSMASPHLSNPAGTPPPSLGSRGRLPPTSSPPRCGRAWGRSAASRPRRWIRWSRPRWRRRPGCCSSPAPTCSLSSRSTATPSTREESGCKAGGFKKYIASVALGKGGGGTLGRRGPGRWGGWGEGLKGPSSFSVGLLGSLRRRPFDGLLFGSGRARCLRPPTGGRSCGPLRCRRRRGGGSGGRGDGSGIAALHGPAAHTTAGTVATLIACSSRRRNSSRARRRKGGGASSFGVV